MITDLLNRLTDPADIAKIRRAILPAHLSEQLELDEQGADEAERTKHIAARAEINKQADRLAAGIAEKTEAAKANYDAAAEALKLAQSEYRVAIGEQRSASHRTSADLARIENELRKLAPGCIAEALLRIQADEVATRKGVLHWEADRGSQYRDSVRYERHTNRAAITARLTALRDARAAIHDLPLKIASVADMQKAIEKLFSKLPSID